MLLFHVLQALHSLIQAFVHCRLDYCNSVPGEVAHLFVQNMAGRKVSGVRWSEHITPVLEDLHWLPVSQRVVFKTALMVWKCVHGIVPAYLSDLCIPAYRHLRLSASAICSDGHSAGSTRLDCNWTTKFCTQWTSHMEPSATSTTVTGPVAECRQAGTEDAPVLDHPAPLRRCHHSGAGYKYPDLLTYLLLYNTLQCALNLLKEFEYNLWSDGFELMNKFCSKLPQIWVYFVQASTSTPLLGVLESRRPTACWCVASHNAWTADWNQALYCRQ